MRSKSAVAGRMMVLSVVKNVLLDGLLVIDDDDWDGHHDDDGKIAMLLHVEFFITL